MCPGCTEKVLGWVCLGCTEKVLGWVCPGCTEKVLGWACPGCTEKVLGWEVIEVGEVWCLQQSGTLGVPDLKSQREGVRMGLGHLRGGMDRCENLSNTGRGHFRKVARGGSGKRRDSCRRDSEEQPFDRPGKTSKRAYQTASVG